MSTWLSACAPLAAGSANGRPPLTCASLDQLELLLAEHEHEHGHEHENENEPFDENNSVYENDSVYEPDTMAPDLDRHLRDYNIFTKDDSVLPPALQEFLREQILAQRECCSPTAKRIADKSRVRAIHMSEATAISFLSHHILFQQGDYPGLDVQLNVDLLYNLPPAVVPTTAPLKRPLPDMMLGYEPESRCPTSEESNAPFSHYLESALGFATGTANTQLFPFLTAQWKCAGGHNGSIPTAMYQSARDGAAIIQHNRAIYTAACKEGDQLSSDRSVVDTCHFSVTTDMLTLYLFVHWCEVPPAEPPRFYMKEVTSGFLKKPEEMSRFRMILRNILDHAMGARLQKLRDALQSIHDNETAKANARRGRKKAASSDSGFESPGGRGSKRQKI